MSIPARLRRTAPDSPRALRRTDTNVGLLDPRRAILDTPSFRPPALGTVDDIHDARPEGRKARSNRPKR